MNPDNLHQFQTINSLLEVMIGIRDELVPAIKDRAERNFEPLATIHARNVNIYLTGVAERIASAIDSPSINERLSLYNGCLMGLLFGLPIHPEIAERHTQLRNRLFQIQEKHTEACNADSN